MIETFQDPEVRVPQAPLAEMNPVLTEAEISVAAQSVVNGAEIYLQQHTETPVVEPAAEQRPVEFNMDMLKLFMLVKDEQARQMLAGAIALDVVGQQNGIKEFTFDYAREAAYNRQAAIEADVDLRRRRAAQEEDEEDKKKAA